MTERISVIVPAYNAGEHLTAALASLAGQARPPDEVVVVDDGSTDDTAVVAKRWAELLPLVLVQNESNLGLGATRRVGIERASGELIALLDADDYALPDHLDVLLETWRGHGGVAVADAYRWVPGQRLGHHGWVARAIPPPADQARAILFGNFSCYATLFSRAAYDRAGGFRPLRRCEDWELWIRMIRSGSVLTAAPTPTLIYRRRPDSLSAGDGCVAGNIAVLEGVVEEVRGPEREWAATALRRHRARARFVAAFDDVAAGRLGRARLQWLRAAVEDRGLRSIDPGLRGSVALRALACMAAPGRAMTRRHRRLVDPDVLTR
jgi:glycosyltransferase involved in cell wall biosynthesis